MIGLINSVHTVTIAPSVYPKTSTMTYEPFSMILVAVLVAIAVGFGITAFWLLKRDDDEEAAKELDWLGSLLLFVPTGVAATIFGMTLSNRYVYSGLRWASSTLIVLVFFLLLEKVLADMLYVRRHRPNIDEEERPDEKNEEEPDSKDAQSESDDFMDALMNRHRNAR